MTDASGAAIAGVRIALNGSVQAVTVTSATGAYSVSVNPGSYSLNPSGLCTSFTPGVVNLNNITKNQTQNFTASGCPTPPA